MRNLLIDYLARPRPDRMGYLSGLLAGEYLDVSLIVTKNYGIRVELMQLSRWNWQGDIGVAYQAAEMGKIMCAPKSNGMSK